MTLTVVNWNVIWGNPKWVRPIILQRIFEHKPEVICLTEADDGLLAEYGGHAIRPEYHFGQGVDGLKRKVLLWSQNPWASIDLQGDTALPPGRFISGVTETSVGEVTVAGVCIPWGGSRTKRYGGDRQEWQDHEQYLDGLGHLLAKNIATQRLIVMGDFNHTIGQDKNPYPPSNRLREKLAPAMAAGELTIVTAALGFQRKGGIRRAIDHIAISNKMSAVSLGVISNCNDTPDDLSDHFGVFARLIPH